MRKIITATFVSMDGVLQAPGGPDEDPSNGFKWGGWTFNYQDDMSGKTMNEFMSQPFDLLLGRRTYEIFAAYWPYEKNASTRYYGIIRKDSYQLMLQTLTEDSKKNVEMLDKNIFQMFFLQNISDSIIYLGNRKLMAYISDEY